MVPQSKHSFVCSTYLAFGGRLGRGWKSDKPAAIWMMMKYSCWLSSCQRTQCHLSCWDASAGKDSCSAKGYRSNVLTRIQAAWHGRHLLSLQMCRNSPTCIPFSMKKWRFLSYSGSVPEKT